MPLSEIKKEIIAQKTDVAKFLFTQLKRNPPAKGKEGKIAGDPKTVIFVAYPGSDQLLQFRLLPSKNNKVILKAWAKRHDLPINGKVFTEDFDPTLKNIRSNLQKAQDEIKRLPDIKEMAEIIRSNLPEGIETPKQPFGAKKEKNPKKPKDEAEAEFIKAINEAMAKKDETAPDKRFWKTDVNPWIDVENPCIDVENPCINVERKRKYHEGTYILEADFAKVKEYLGKGGKRICAEVLPQPYIGDPDASIWILSMNPSYSAVDVYDMKDCGRDAKMAVLLDMGYDEQTSKKLLQHNVFPHDREEDLKKRKGLMQSQLSFSSTEFYVLNPAFDTVPTNDEIQKAGVQSTNQTYNKGSYRWWKKYLFERNICSPDGVNRDNEEKCRNKLEKFFVLESFPYHSENFDSGKEFFNNVVRQVCHYEFWKKMVEFALKKGKILLCRGENIAERVSQIAMDKKMSNAQIYVFSSLRSLWISTGNFQKYQRK